MTIWLYVWPCLCPYNYKVGPYDRIVLKNWCSFSSRFQTKKISREAINNFHVACYTHMDSVIEFGCKSYASYEKIFIIFKINLPKQYTYLIWILTTDIFGLIFFSPFVRHYLFSKVINGLKMKICKTKKVNSLA